jgi:DNA-binding MarR family transcriptional regulator
MSATPASDEAGGPYETAGRSEAGPAEATRRDLAAMVVPLARALVAAEEPVLRAHQVSMWAYVVLTALSEQPVRTQAALAQWIGADKSRIIGVLDELQERGLIERRPDPADRRVYLLSLTDVGRRLRESVRDAIQRQEEERVLSLLPDTDRAAFLRALRILSELPSPLA